MCFPCGSCAELTIPSVMRGAAWSPVRLLPVWAGSLSLLPLRPYLLLSAPTARCPPTELPAGWGRGQCRWPGGTAGRTPSGSRSWAAAWPPDTVHRRYVCSEAPEGSCPCGSTGRSRRCSRCPHTEPWSSWIRGVNVSEEMQKVPDSLHGRAVQIHEKVVD